MIRNKKRGGHLKENDKYFAGERTVLKAFGILAFVWGILCVFGIAAELILSGGFDLALPLWGSSIGIIAFGFTTICGFFSYRYRMSGAGAFPFIFTAISLLMSVAMLFVFIYYDPAKTVYTAVVAAFSAALTVSYLRK
jgi:hypothetical protein